MAVLCLRLKTINYKLRLVVNRKEKQMEDKYYSNIKEYLINNETFKK